MLDELAADLRCVRPNKSHQMIESTTQKAILAEYDHFRDLFQDLTDVLKDLTTRLVAACNVRLHSVTCRCKARGSLSAKLAKPDKGYKQLSEVTDIAAVRIITYFGEDVDVLARMIEAEFDIDREHSIDKRHLLDPERFGYHSLHYVAKFGPARAGLSEYQRFAGIRFEVQVRFYLAARMGRD